MSDKKPKSYRQSKRFNILLIVCLSMAFIGSIWCMDISVSSLISSACSGDDFRTSGIFFANVEPRVTYHLAIIFLWGVWAIICAMLIWKTVKE